MDISPQTDALVSLLRDEIRALRDSEQEVFIATILGQSSRYVQGTISGNGRLLLEVASNRFLGDVPLDEAALSALAEIGWNPPEDYWPNHWREWPVGQEDNAAEILAQTLRVVFGVSTLAELHITHDDGDCVEPPSLDA